MATVSKVLRKCKAALEGHYGSQLKGLVLCGSVARNQLYRNAKREGILV